MALTPTLHDLDVELQHVDRGLALRLPVRAARHPSESLPRLWLRVLAYLLWHEERLVFGPGLCEPETPDLVADDLTGHRTLLVRVGKQDPAKLQREADRAGGARVAVLFESPRALESFVEAAREAGCGRLGRVELVALDPALLAGLAEVEERRTKLSLTVVGDHLYVERGGASLDGPLTRATLA